MNTPSSKPARGRPKTTDRNHMLDVATQAYWAKGARGVSVNDICRQAQVGKPSLYREFGNEDGLMTAALTNYYESQILPLQQALAEADTEFPETLDWLISMLVVMDDDQDMPKGCLLVKMRESRLRVGDSTRAQIDKISEQILTAYEAWVEHAKSKGEFSADFSSRFAAIYIDAQITNALSQLARGDPPKTVRDVLTAAFLIFD